VAESVDYGCISCGNITRIYSGEEEICVYCGSLNVQTISQLLDRVRCHDTFGESYRELTWGDND
jgi:DNA-directed RNA polymerase subunit RPC12/RpoP